MDWNAIGYTTFICKALAFDHWEGPMDSHPDSPHTAQGIPLIQAFAHLFRLPLAVMAALASCATIYAVDATTPLWKYGLTTVILFCMTAAACAINDYWDVGKDRIDHPDRPLPSGALSLQQAWWAAILLFGISLMGAIPLGLYPTIVVAVSVGLLWNYSHLLLYSGILGNFIVATIGSTLIFLASLVANRPLAMLYPIGFLFCYALAKEIVWDVHDARGDRSQGITTIANLWGDRAAFFIAWTLLAGLLGSIPIAVYRLPMAYPWLFVGFASAVLFTLGIALAHYQQQRSAIAYQTFISWERLSMMFGIFALLATAPPGA
jgi:geranylgeranylglycerol-phosphate geranylgeranyltransferase